MNIKSVYIKNFGPHHETYLQLHPTGVNYIFGSNGSGKTQLVGAILFALMGYHSSIRIDKSTLKNQSCTVSLVLEDGQNTEELECQISDFPNVTIPVKRIICYPPTNGAQVPLHRQILDNINIPNSPRLSLETYDGVREVVLPDFLKLDAVTAIIKNSPELQDAWEKILNLIDYSKDRIPDVGSYGLKALLKILEEFSRRFEGHGNIPLIIDGGFDFLDYSTARIVAKLLEHIAQRSQIILLSASPEPKEWFSQEIITGYYELGFTPEEWTPSSVYYDWQSENFSEVDANTKTNIPLVMTEGKTDWKHIKAALKEFKSQGKFIQLQVEFSEFDNAKMGSRELLRLCAAISQFKNPRKIICIFDRDEQDIVQKVTSSHGDYRDWGNNVYSIALPIPNHRRNQHDLCIEMYYSDKDITRTDKYGRRLFISNEFSTKSGRHLSNNRLVYAHAGKLREDNATIIDNDVFDSQDKNMALPKDKFAEYVLNQLSGFKNINFDGFENLLLIVSSISRI